MTMTRYSQLEEVRDAWCREQILARPTSVLLNEADAGWIVSAHPLHHVRKSSAVVVAIALRGLTSHSAPRFRLRQLESAYRAVADLEDLEVAQRAQLFLDALHRFLEHYPSLLPRVSLRVLDGDEDDTITFEWTLEDRRLGWVFAATDADNGWYFASKETTSGGPMEELEKEVHRMRMLQK